MVCSAVIVVQLGAIHIVRANATFSEPNHELGVNVRFNEHKLVRLVFVKFIVDGAELLHENLQLSMKLLHPGVKVVRRSGARTFRILYVVHVEQFLENTLNDIHARYQYFIKKLV